MKHLVALTSLRVTEYPAGGAMAPHAHDELSLIVVAAGTYLERIGGREAEQRRGCMLLYPAGAVHSQRFGPRGVRKIVFRRTRPAWSICATMGSCSMGHAR